MGTFDNPFDPNHRLGDAHCPCGLQASLSEHDQGASHRLHQPPAESKEMRYERVVASAVMRSIFPQDATRRAFLKLAGVSTALAALSQFFPLETATELFAQGAGSLEKKDLKVGFIPITCATPIIMAHPMGFYSKHGLNVEVVKTAGWAVVDHQQGVRRGPHALAHAACNLAWSRLPGDPVCGPGDREHQRSGHHAFHQAQGPARSEAVEGIQICDPLRLFHAQLSFTLLSG